jgi:single-strand DNA-binding protein
MRGVNSIHILGNLGKDPELRYSSGGTAVANFSVAVGEKKKVDGEWQDHTEWFNVVLFGKTAETAGEWLKKGSGVYVSGRLQTRSYDGKDGEKRYITEVVGDNMRMVGGKSAESELDPKEEPEPSPPDEKDDGLPEPPPPVESDDDLPF